MFSSLPSCQPQTSPSTSCLVQSCGTQEASERKVGRCCRPSRLAALSSPPPNHCRRSSVSQSSQASNCLLLNAGCRVSSLLTRGLSEVKLASTVSSLNSVTCSPLLPPA